MKKKIAVLLVFIAFIGILSALSSCKKNSGGKLICGITDFEPMNFRDSSGKWTGFDTEFALLVGEKIGMEIEFQEIEWSQKYSELDAGSINVIWNGFTANASEDGVPRSDLVDFSHGYMLNQQCVVIKSERKAEFSSKDSLKGKSVAAEKGSAGESEAKDLAGDGVKIIESAAQINTFIEVKSGAVDFAVVDILLAKKIAGTGDYSDLTIADITLDSEIYAVGFKKGDALRQKVNEAMKNLYDSGKLMELAEKYGLENTLIMDTAFLDS